MNMNMYRDPSHEPRTLAVWAHVLDLIVLMYAHLKSPKNLMSKLIMYTFMYVVMQ